VPTALYAARKPPAGHCTTSISHTDRAYVPERPRHRRTLHSFPTRRSSDLLVGEAVTEVVAHDAHRAHDVVEVRQRLAHELRQRRDRKSTRLNSSHVKSSYAVFCLKKKKKTPSGPHRQGNAQPEHADVHAIQ